MGLFEKIISLLNDNSVDYTLIEHEAVFTSEQAAKIRGMDLESGAKAMVCFADKLPVLLVLSGAKKINTKLAKQMLHVQDLRFATPEEVSRVTSVEIGAVPPFGSCMEIQTYCDSSLSKNDLISFNPGIHTKSITMAYEDFVQVEQPILGDFSNC